MKRLGNYLPAILPALLFAGIASANTLIVNCGTVSGPTELVSAAILCGQFNIGGATLSNVSIAVSGGISGSITLTNGDVSPQSGSGTSTTGFSFGPLSGFSFVNPVYSPSFTTGVQPLAAGQTAVFSGLSGTSNGSLGNDNTIFAPYTGGGTFNVLASTANATAVVTYTYNFAAPAPEPSTISLFGMGLLGFSFLARKFRVRK